MKNIAIFGSARSGKSTLSIMISKRFPNYHVICGDDIRNSFQEILPKNNINSKGGSGMLEDFPRFLSCLFYKNIERNKGYFNYIVETPDISPEKAKELFNRNNTILLFIGTPNQTVEENFNQIRKYETKRDFTYGRSDEEILYHCRYWIPKAKEYQEKCKELNIWYVDTSVNRMEVLEDTLNKISKMVEDDI